jgi:hypothetical protein
MHFSCTLTLRTVDHMGTNICWRWSSSSQTSWCVALRLHQPAGRRGKCSVPLLAFACYLGLFIGLSSCPPPSYAYTACAVKQQVLFATIVAIIVDMLTLASRNPAGLMLASPPLVMVGQTTILSL